MLNNRLDIKFVQLVNVRTFRRKIMQNIDTKCSFKSGAKAFIKYVFATAMLGVIVLLVVATYVAAK